MADQDYSPPLQVQGLSADQIVQAWELGHQRPGWYKALLLLTPALPTKSLEDVSALSIGQRNGHLFELRKTMIGHQMDVFVECPQCQEHLELAIDLDEFGESHQAPPATETFTFHHQELVLTYRLLTSRDLATGAGKGSVEACRQTLIATCFVGAERNGQPIALDELDASAIEALSQEITEKDHLADNRLPLKCFACEHVWRASFDVVALLWKEIEMLAERLLDDVHVLARAYGWRASDVLSMSSIRRRHFLNAVS